MIGMSRSPSVGDECNATPATRGSSADQHAGGLNAAASTAIAIVAHLAKAPAIFPLPLAHSGLTGKAMVGRSRVM
jgi:hypothetical protein